MPRSTPTKCSSLIQPLIHGPKPCFWKYWGTSPLLCLHPRFLKIEVVYLEDKIYYHLELQTLLLSIQVERQTKPHHFTHNTLTSTSSWFLTPVVAEPPGRLHTFWKELQEPIRPLPQYPDNPFPTESQKQKVLKSFKSFPPATKLYPLPGWRECLTAQGPFTFCLKPPGKVAWNFATPLVLWYSPT